MIENKDKDMESNLVCYFITAQTELYENYNIKVLNCGDKKTNTVIENFTEKVLTHNLPISYDLETTGLDFIKDKVLLAQFCITLPTQRKIALIVDVVTCFNIWVRIITDLQHNTFIGSNIKFDYKFTKEKTKVSLVKLEDIMIYQQLLTAGKYTTEQIKKYKPYSLNSIVERYENVYLNKSIRKNFVNKNKPFTEQELVYSLEDVLYLESIRNKQLNQLKSYDLLNVAKLECVVLPVYGDIELKGVNVDISIWEKLTKKALKEAETAETELCNWVRNNYQKYNIPFQNDLFSIGVGINWSSEKQVLDIFKKIGFDVTYFDPKQGKQKEGVNAIVRNRYKDHSFVSSYNKYQKASKIISSFGYSWIEKYVHSSTGRVHPEYNQLGTSTGRVSCKNPNLQQIPGGEYREAFTAPKGKKIITIDYSQAEIRIVAALSGEQNLIKALNNNEDPYGAVGSAMFGVPVSKTENKHLRQVSKIIVLGKNYGAGPAKIAEQLGCSVEEAEKHLIAFDNANKKLNEYLEKANKFARTVRYSTTMSPYRRRCWYDTSEKDEGAIGRNGQNQPIQGTNADIVKEASYRVWKYLKNIDGAFIVNQIHDEIVIECFEKDAQKIATEAIQLMEKAGKTVIKSVKMTATCAIEDHWSKD